MSRIMEDIAEITGGRSFHSYKYSYDSLRTPSPDYDDNPDEIESWARDGETKPKNVTTDLREYAIELARNRPVPCLQFFQDGSRHVYQVDDISYDSRVFPVVAGQIGVACCQRIHGRMEAVQPTVRKLVVSLPNKCDKSGFIVPSKRRLMIPLIYVSLALRFKVIFTSYSKPKQRG